MQIKENQSLKELTTMKVGGPAKYFVEVSNIDELKEAIAFAHDKELEIFMLGGGSNMIIADRGLDGLVIKTNFVGFEINGEQVHVSASENWDKVVERCVDVGLWGIENMSFIPGTAGGAIIQNAGAYGQEIKDVIVSVDVFDTQGQELKTISKDECKFSYRKSIFNSDQKGRYVILDFTMQLSKDGKPNTERNLQKGSIQQMRDQVIEVRKSKGQDPAEYSSAGSFFKNLIITKEQYEKLPEGTPSFEMEDSMVKVPTGYILDKILNLKGTSVGGAELSEKQVINIINTGNATSDDVMQLFKKVRQLVHEKLGIEIVNEPELIGFSQDELDNYFSLE